MGVLHRLIQAPSCQINKIVPAAPPSPEWSPGAHSAHHLAAVTPPITICGQLTPISLNRLPRIWVSGGLDPSRGKHGRLLTSSRRGSPTTRGLIIRGAAQGWLLSNHRNNSSSKRGNRCTRQRHITLGGSVPGPPTSGLAMGNTSNWWSCL